MVRPVYVTLLLVTLMTAGVEAAGKVAWFAGDPGVDQDGDGAPAYLDCDDADASVAPGTPERCDGRDQDCDGDVDEHAVDARVWVVGRGGRYLICGG